MNDLRRQLDDLRGGYAAEKYPGDLAAQLLRTEAMIPRVPQSARRGRLVIRWAGAAIAAGIALAIVLYEPAVQAVQNSMQRLTQNTQLPFVDNVDPPQPFGIVPEYRAINVPMVPPLPVPPTDGAATANQESA